MSGNSLVLGNFEAVSYQSDLAACPICGKPVQFKLFRDRHTNITYWNISCPRKCFPDGLYVSEYNDKDARKLVHRWNSQLVPAIEKWKKLSSQSPKCPHCDKPTRLLPFMDRGSMFIRPVCIQNNCPMPAQWHFTSSKWQSSEMAGQVRRWSRERLQFMLWFSKKIDQRLNKDPGLMSCPLCHARAVPILKKSVNVIGEMLWGCSNCGTTIAPVEKTPKGRKKERKNTRGLEVRDLDVPMCAICKRTEGQIEAVGSSLEKHHIVPLEDGGDDTKSNLMLMCHECHAAWHKAHRKLKGDLKKQAEETIQPEEKSVFARFLNKTGNILRRLFLKHIFFVYVII